MYRNQTFEDECREIHNNFYLESLNETKESYREEIKRLEKLITVLNEQIVTVENTAFKTVIRFSRDKWGKGLNVMVNLVPDIPDGEKTLHSTEDYKRFPLRERRVAKEYAESLAQKYIAPIIKTGFED
jgi:hypothetical protein